MIFVLGVTLGLVLGGVVAVLLLYWAIKDMWRR